MASSGRVVAEGSPLDHGPWWGGAKKKVAGWGGGFPGLYLSMFKFEQLDTQPPTPGQINTCGEIRKGGWVEGGNDGVVMAECEKRRATHSAGALRARKRK